MVLDRKHNIIIIYKKDRKQHSRNLKTGKERGTWGTEGARFAM